MSLFLYTNLFSGYDIYLKKKNENRFPPHDRKGSKFMQNTTCTRLKILRTSHGLTQAELAENLNVSREAYSLYENGKRQMNYEALCAVADFYSVSLDYLLGRVENTQNYQLDDVEMQLLDLYRSCDLRGRASLMEIAKIHSRYSSSEGIAKKPISHGKSA